MKKRMDGLKIRASRKSMINFKIGNLLRENRIKLKLSQKEFVGNIISVSQYSRIESGLQDIRSNDLINILLLNQISIKDFFEKVENEADSKEPLTEAYVFNELSQAFYERDLNRVQKLEYQTRSLKLSLSLELRIKMVTAILSNRLDKITVFDKQRFIDELSRSDDWTRDRTFLQLFGNSMMVIDNNDTLNLYMDEILNTYQNIQDEELNIQKRIAGICINYLARSYLKSDTLLVSKTINLLSKLSQNPELLMYKLLGRYFRYLFGGDDVKRNKLLSLLQSLGYGDFVNNLPR